MSAESLILVFLAIVGSSALYENCDYYQTMELGKTYYVYSPAYPNKYKPGMSCRFYAVSPPGTYINLNCDNISIPSSRECYYDRLTISKSGSNDLSDGVNYCGKGSIHIKSTSNRINIVAVAGDFSPGGTFLCSVDVFWQESKCECGWKNQHRIVGGLETNINEYPMMAGLVDATQGGVFCGATIISQKFAVTAAHCLVIKERPGKIGLLVGDHDISVGNDTHSAKLHYIDRFIIHPEYSTISYVNDIGLVRVRERINFDRRVGPACLPFLNVGESFVGETVVALGWGSIKFTGSTSNKLLKAPLSIIGNDMCQRRNEKLIVDTQVCTYAENRDACQSDSGGPILWTDRVTGRIKLLGIISYGIQCATEHPGVNTRVTKYVDWIRSRTGEKYCLV